MHPIQNKWKLIENSKKVFKITTKNEIVLPKFKIDSQFYKFFLIYFKQIQN